MMSAGRKEKVALGKLLAQVAYIIGGWIMIPFQTNQDITVLRADASGITVGSINAANRQSNVVDDRPELRRGNGLPNAMLDVIEQSRRFFNPSADWGSNMQTDLPRVDGREEITPEERREAERQKNDDQETCGEYVPVLKCEYQ